VAQATQLAQSAPKPRTRSLPEARYLAMAAISTVTDLGRRLHWHDTPEVREQVHTLLRQILELPPPEAGVSDR